MWVVSPSPCRLQLLCLRFAKAMPVEPTTLQLMRREYKYIKGGTKLRVPSQLIVPVNPPGVATSETVDELPLCHRGRVDDY